MKRSQTHGSARPRLWCSAFEAAIPKFVIYTHSVDFFNSLCWHSPLSPYPQHIWVCEKVPQLLDLNVMTCYLCWIPARRSGAQMHVDIWPLKRYEQRRTLSLNYEKTMVPSALVSSDDKDFSKLMLIPCREDDSLKFCFSALLTLLLWGQFEQLSWELFLKPFALLCGSDSLKTKKERSTFWTHVSMCYVMEPRTTSSHFLLRLMLTKSLTAVSGAV